MGNCCSPACRLWCLWWCLFVLSFFPRGVLDEILHLIESVSEGFPSYSYRNMDMIRERIIFTFDPRDMLISLHIGFSFVRAAVACAILERTSSFEPSSAPIAPRYLKLVTLLSFCPFTLIFLWMQLALFVIRFVFRFVFSALISIWYLLQMLSRLLTRASSSCSSSSMSSANHRLVLVLPPMLTFPSCSSRASDIIISRKMLMRVGERRYPCLLFWTILLCCYSSELHL